MGHSDVVSLQEIERAGADAEGVQVWGDMSRPPQVEPEAPGAEGEGGAGPSAGDLYQRVGHLTRTLHDALRELGYHDSLADARDNLPDARDRLTYIARLTGDAAEKVLNSVDRARSVQDAMGGEAASLHARWSAVAAFASAEAARATPAGRELVEQTCAFLAGLGDRTGQTNGILTEIMMAQDFHDLTGQVIRRVVTLSQELEEQLVKLLIEATPASQRKKIEVGLEGPVVNAENRSDVVADQQGVDDLLASLGF